MEERTYRGNGPYNQAFDFGRINPSFLAEVAHGGNDQVGRALALAFEDSAFLQPRYGCGSLVIGVDHFFQVEIGEPVFRYKSADGCNRSRDLLLIGDDNFYCGQGKTKGGHHNQLLTNLPGKIPANLFPLNRWRPVNSGRMTIFAA